MHKANKTFLTQTLGFHGMAGKAIGICWWIFGPRARVVLATPLSRWLPLHAPIRLPNSEDSLGTAGSAAQEPGLAQHLTHCF